MTELTDDKIADQHSDKPANNANGSMQVAQLGLDDGYAFTKVALPDGRLLAIPSRARIGQSGVTWIRAAPQCVFEYHTEGTTYSVGAVDGDPTHFDGYPISGMNRAIVQHAMQQAGLSGQSVHVVSGLPVGAFYRNDGQQRQRSIQNKRDSLKLAVEPVSTVGASHNESLKVSVAFHEVIPEALAAWYDYLIVTSDDGVTLDADRLSAPIAIVDIGGRTTDYVVVQNQGVIHGSSGSLNRGMLNVKAQVANGIQVQFDLDNIGELRLSEALESHRVRLHDKDHDVSALVIAAKRELVERLYAETRRQLGQGAELDRILFVGGGSVALAPDIADWFPNQQIADHPAFANARGMLKYLQFVCEDTARLG